MQWYYYKMNRKKEDFLIKRYQLEHLVPLAITILSIFLWIKFFQETPFKIIGLVLNITGLIIWWSAKITLGENWDAGYGKPQIKKLVTNGVYSKIRHPLYWGINLTLLGMTLIYSKNWFVLTSLVIVIYFFSRMSIEDKYLLKKLGKKYEKYKKKTWI
jgi:protein-S-isoprenylcysteine O-methyltransferase Ste14